MEQTSFEEAQSLEINEDQSVNHLLKMSEKIPGNHLSFANRNVALLCKATFCAFLWGDLPETGEKFSER